MQARRKRRGHDPPADSCAGFGECRDVVDVERVEFPLDASREACVREEVPVRVRRRRKTVRHGDAQRSQVRDHFAERRVLAADVRDVVASQPGKRKRVRSHGAPCYINDGGETLRGMTAPWEPPNR
jgi:hypothetical protein